MREPREHALPFKCLNLDARHRVERVGIGIPRGEPCKRTKPLLHPLLAASVAARLRKMRASIAVDPHAAKRGGGFSRG